MILPIILIILGFILLIKGADFLVDGSINIAKKFHIPEVIIGLTVISIGTTMPELFVSVTSALDGYPDMAVGNAIGSCIANLLLILGASSVIKSINFEKDVKYFYVPVCLFVSIIFIIFCNINNDVTSLEGIVLLLLFAIFISSLAIKGMKNQKDEMKKSKEFTDNSKSKLEIFKNIFFILIGIVLLKFGGDFTVDNAVIVAKQIGLSDKVIGLTILAIGTSLPEFVTCVSAAIKDKTDIAIGNILGANILNLLLITGISSAITPIKYNISYNRDMVIFIISTTILLLFPYIKPKNEMSRMNGIIYIIIYFGYMASLFI